MKRRSYGIIENERKIEFWSDDKELVRQVSEYINNVIDAEKYRSQLEEVSDRRIV